MQVQETRTTPSVQPHIHATEACELPDLHHILEIARRGYQLELQFVQLPPEVLLLIIDHMNMADRISLLATTVKPTAGKKFLGSS